MLYLGHDPKPSWDYPDLDERGYANPEAYAFWAKRDPIPTYAENYALAKGPPCSSPLQGCVIRRV